MKVALAGLRSSWGRRDYLLGNDFTVADANLFAVLNWSAHAGINMAQWPVLATYVARQAMQAEGLLKP